MQDPNCAEQHRAHAPSKYPPPYHQPPTYRSSAPPPHHQGPPTGQFMSPGQPRPPYGSHEGFPPSDHSVQGKHSYGPSYAPYGPQKTHGPPQAQGSPYSYGPPHSHDPPNPNGPPLSHRPPHSHDPHMAHGPPPAHGPPHSRDPQMAHGPPLSHGSPQSHGLPQHLHAASQFHGRHQPHPLGLPPSDKHSKPYGREDSQYPPPNQSNHSHTRPKDDTYHRSRYPSDRSEPGFSDYGSRGGNYSPRDSRHYDKSKDGQVYAHKRHHPEHSGPPPSWTEQHSEQFTERNEPTKDFSGKAEDQEWVNTWLAKNKINHRLKEKKTEATMAIPDAKQLLREAMEITENLQLAQSQLQENFNSPAEAWQNLSDNDRVLKSRLAEIKELMSTSVVQQLAAKVEKIKTKRERLKAKRKRCYREQQRKLRRREELHQQIDAWRTRILKIDEDKKKEKELKAAADETLGEVRRKLSEAEKARDLLKAMTKLRQLRKDAAERKGITTPRESDTDFEEHKDELLVMLHEQLEIYEREKKTLEAMLEMEAEENREKELEEKKRKIEELERRKERTIKRFLFGRDVPLEDDNPMLPFRTFYEQAESSIEALIQIRREWDLFLVPPSTGGSRIPEGWVMPAEPSSGTWASVLKDRQILT